MDPVRVPSVIDQSHPAYGSGQAWFQFAFAPGGIVKRLTLVEARNPWAVMALELILARGGSVSETCSVVAIFRQCPSIGMRSDLIQEVEYVDFMVDVVDPALLLQDPETATAFRRSLSAEERAYVSAKMDLKIQALGPVESSEEPESVPVASRPPAAKASGKSAETLISALVGLGFDKRAVREHVQGLGARTESVPMPDLIRESLQALA